MENDLKNDKNFKSFSDWLTLKTPFYEANEFEKNINNLIGLKSITDKELRKVVSYLIKNDHKDCLDKVLPDTVKNEITGIVKQ